MQQLVSPIVPFPNVYWWSLALMTDELIFDVAEHFQKMTYRNRYYITGANGLIQLTIPLARGRNQRTAMDDVMIDNKEQWQVQHWRTLVSVYGRAPFFEHFAVELETFFTKPYEKLVDFNRESIAWAKKQLRASYQENQTETYQQEYTEPIKDIRKIYRPGIEQNPVENSLYYQVFSERHGFYPNLSILDLLFAEGPAAVSIIEQNRQQIDAWIR